VKETREKRGKANMEMVALGPIKCLQQGYIKADNYYNAVKSLNLYKLHT